MRQFLLPLRSYLICRVFSLRVIFLTNYFKDKRKHLTRTELRNLECFESLSCVSSFVGKKTMYFIEDHYYTINKPALKALGIWPSDRSRIVILKRVLIFLILGSHMFVQVIGLRTDKNKWIGDCFVLLFKHDLCACVSWHWDIFRSVLVYEREWKYIFKRKHIIEVAFFFSFGLIYNRNYYIICFQLSVFITKECNMALFLRFATFACPLSAMIVQYCFFMFNLKTVSCAHNECTENDYVYFNFQRHTFTARANSYNIRIINKVFTFTYVYICHTR